MSHSVSRASRSLELAGVRLVLVAVAVMASSGPLAGQTTFTFGGYVKLDVMWTNFHNGFVPETSPLRDFLVPALIPVGDETDRFVTNDFNARESRFSFGTNTEVGAKAVRTYLEIDFLLSGQGDERVSNSFNPRLRQVFFEYDGWLLGQTWTTFQILNLPEDVDFIGVPDGTIFIRQPQVRFSPGNWEFALENSKTTLLPTGGGERLVCPGSFVPDLVARYNFGGEWGYFSVAGLLRRLDHEYIEAGDRKHSAEPGYGVSVGGMFRLGERDDIRFQASGGRGLGRYAALNFVTGGIVRPNNGIDPIPSILGFVGYRHSWSPALRSNLNLSGVTADPSAPLSGGDSDKAAYSVSVNLLYSPIPDLTFGAEIMRAYRELEDGTNGRLTRLQFAGRYNFQFSAVTSGEDKD